MFFGKNCNIISIMPQHTFARKSCIHRRFFATKKRVYRKNAVYTLIFLRLIYGKSNSFCAASTCPAVGRVVGRVFSMPKASYLEPA